VHEIKTVREFESGALSYIRRGSAPTSIADTERKSAKSGHLAKRLHVRHGHCQQPPTGTQFPLLVREEGNYVMGNLCGSADSVVGWAGIQLHIGWIYSFVAGARSGRPGN
jgi:hypothetical protein